MKKRETMNKELASNERAAIAEWVKRPNFHCGIPENFYHDICSEGIKDAAPIFLEISRRLDLLAADYRRAAKEADGK